MFGAERMILELAQSILEMEYEPIIGVLENKSKYCEQLAITAKSLELRVAVFKCSKQLDLRTIRRIRQFLKKNQIDFIHTHGYKANFYALISSRFMKIPCIATCHPWTETNYSFKARVYTLFDRKWLRMMDCIVSVSDEVKQQVLRSIPRVECQVIPNGIHVDRFNRTNKDKYLLREFGLSKSDIVIGTIGRLVPEKGHTSLIQCAKETCKANKHTKFIIVGDGPLRNTLERMVIEYNLDHKIQFVGTRSDIPELLSILDIFVLPSISEGLPMVILEAMAAQKPIIGTKVGDIPKVIQHCDTGLLVPPNDVKALANAIQMLLNDKAHGSKMAIEANKVVSTNYSSKQMAKRYIRQYERHFN